MSVHLYCARETFWNQLWVDLNVDCQSILGHSFLLNDCLICNVTNKLSIALFLNSLPQSVSRTDILFNDALTVENACSPSFISL